MIIKSSTSVRPLSVEEVAFKNYAQSFPTLPEWLQKEIANEVRDFNIEQRTRLSILQKEYMKSGE